MIRRPTVRGAAISGPVELLQSSQSLPSVSLAEASNTSTSGSTQDHVYAESFEEVAGLSMDDENSEEGSTTSFGLDYEIHQKAQHVVLSSEERQVRPGGIWGRRTLERS